MLLNYVKKNVIELRPTLLTTYTIRYLLSISKILLEFPAIFFIIKKKRFERLLNPFTKIKYRHLED